MQRRSCAITLVVLEREFRHVSTVDMPPISLLNSDFCLKNLISFLCYVHMNRLPIATLPSFLFLESLESSQEFRARCYMCRKLPAHKISSTLNCNQSELRPTRRRSHGHRVSICNGSTIRRLSAPASPARVAGCERCVGLLQGPVIANRQLSKPPMWHLRRRRRPTRTSHGNAWSGAVLAGKDNAPPRYVASG